MLDGYYKATTDRFWNFLAGGLVRAGLSPNQVTLIGLALVVANCALYVVHESTLWLGVLLAVSFAFDGLDGAVARLTNRTSKFGGYLDAIIDRYQEAAVFLVLAVVVENLWLPCFLTMTGSLFISYNKARAAVEITIDNDTWPDLLERLERVVILCTLLVFDPILNDIFALEGQVLRYGLWILAILTHATAIQRFFRARRLIEAAGGRDDA
jgi:phosphatidylglycerophosphate synthase